MIEDPSTEVQSASESQQAPEVKPRRRSRAAKRPEASGEPVEQARPEAAAGAPAPASFEPAASESPSQPAAPKAPRNRRPKAAPKADGAAGPAGDVPTQDVPATPAPAQVPAAQDAPAPAGLSEVDGGADGAQGAPEAPAAKRSRSRNRRSGSDKARADAPARDVAQDGAQDAPAQPAPEVQEASSKPQPKSPRADKPARPRAFEADLSQAGVEELRELALHRRRGRPSPQKEQARETILASLENPTPESLNAAREAARILVGAPKPAKRVDAEPTQEKSEPSAPAASDVQAAGADAPLSAEPQTEPRTGSEAPAEQPAGDDAASQQPSEPYGARRRRHERKGEQREERPAQQQRAQRDGKHAERPFQDRDSRQRDGKPADGRPERQDRPRDRFENKKGGKGDRRDRAGRREREFVTGPSSSLEDLLALPAEELLARAEELGVASEGLEVPALAQIVFDELFKQEGFFTFSGVLELSNDQTGVVRTRGYLPSEADLFMPVSLIRANGLRRGDMIEGTARSARPGEKRPGVCKISTVNGKSPEEVRTRPRFGDLTPVFPSEPLRMEHGKDSILGRVVDLVAPIGKGQRGLIVSPPKAGKTTVLKKIAESIAANNPEVHLICLLVDERPEEVTDMQRSIRGEVVASTFDMPCENHITVSELVIERAKRLVEQGEDVVILLDSITRLARAYNLAQPASGRILSGGVDSTALYPPKRFLGAARNIEFGGSLTILASALVDTGSKMDEVIFEEFKGTGNMELKLDRDLADRRVFPAVDPVASGTRKEELLLDPASAPLVWGVRRILANMNSNERAMNTLIKALRQTATNEEFLMRAAKKAQGNDFAQEF